MAAKRPEGQRHHQFWQTHSPRKLAVENCEVRLHVVGMKLILSTHNVTLTDAIEKHVLAKLDKLDRLNSRVIHARVTLEHDHMRVPERQFCCSIRLGVRS